MKRPWLVPFIPLYGAGLGLRESRRRLGWERTRRLQWPVISIGNLSTGGTGKTPFAIALAGLLQAGGFHVDVLSRGYGRQSSKPARVQPDGAVEDFGDEPILIARQTGVPVYVAAQRYDAGLLAEEEAESHEQRDSREAPLLSAHILDDGFQHRQLARDVDILLLNRADWHDTLLPAGNLREPQSAARRATILAVPAEDPDFKNELRVWGWAGPVWSLRRSMSVPPATGPVAAFCGIAHPKQFFAGLNASGLPLGSQTTFPDHHRYSPDDLNRILSTARAAQATTLITTEKDAVRLAGLASVFPASMPLKTAHLSVSIEEEGEALSFLAATLLALHSRAPL